MYDELSTKRRENPFYNNYVFSRQDINRYTIKWWKHPLLWFLPIYTQVSEGYVFHFKYWQGKVFLVKWEDLHKPTNLTP